MTAIAKKENFDESNFLIASCVHWCAHCMIPLFDDICPICHNRAGGDQLF